VREFLVNVLELGDQVLDIAERAGIDSQVVAVSQ
jgi:hypothetical protein